MGQQPVCIYISKRTPPARFKIWGYYWLVGKEVSKGEERAINLTFSPPSVLHVLAAHIYGWPHVLKRVFGSDCQFFLSYSPTPSAHLLFKVLLFSFTNTWENQRGAAGTANFPTHSKLQMPGHSCTLLAFFYSKVQQFFVFPQHTFLSNAGLLRHTKTGSKIMNNTKKSWQLSLTPQYL